MLTWYLIAICFLSSLLIKPLEDTIGFSMGVNLALLPEFTGLFLLGRQMGKMNPSNKWLALAVSVLITSTAYTVIETYLATAARGRLVGIYYGYSTLNVGLASIASFVILKKLGIQLSTSSSKLASFISTISKAGFGIYLIHLIILGLIQNGYFGFKFNVFTLQPVFAVPLLTIMVFTISYLIVTVMQKIPLIRYIVPE